MEYSIIHNFSDVISYMNFRVWQLDNKRKGYLGIRVDDGSNLNNATVSSGIWQYL